MTWPIAVSPLGPVEIGTVLWRRKGRMRLTAVVKATFAMIHGGFCLPIDPKRISMTEGWWLGGEGCPGGTKVGGPLPPNITQP